MRRKKRGKWKVFLIGGALVVAAAALSPGGDGGSAGEDRAAAYKTEALATKAKVDAKEQKKLRKSLDDKVHGAFMSRVPGDTTGDWRVYIMRSQKTGVEVAAEYRRAYFGEDNEVHFLINKTLGTVTRLTYMAGNIFADEYLYVDKSERNAPDLLKGGMIGSFMVDPATGNATDMLAEDTPTPEPEASAAPTKKMVKKAQKYLKKAGFYEGEATGKRDKATKKAVKKYRKAAGLPVSTQIDDELISSLKSENYGLPADPAPTEAPEEAVEVVDIIPTATATPTPTPTPVPTEPPVQELGATATGGSGGVRSHEDPFEEYDHAEQSKWVLNVGTMKIHHPGCPAISKIAPENYAESDSSLEDLMAAGFEPCGMKQEPPFW